MATQPTNIPVPSESPGDLKFNAGKIDEFVTSMGWTYTDRFGVEHYTIEGMRWLAQQAIAAFGYITLDSFEDGNTLTLPNQVLRLESTGESYRWDGAFPKVVPPNSTPESSGGVGPGKWLSVGDATLRGDLASGGKAGLVGYKDTTVKDTLDSLNENKDVLTAKTGFDKVGRFLNISELRSQAPSSTGQIVYVASSGSASHAETHLGGGFFESVDNVQAWPDDGGIVIKPATGTLVWRRINFTAYDMQFWGVKPDGLTDNAAAITKATNYARANRLILEAPAGSIYTSKTVPIYDNMGIRGQGKAESTVFWKTTNDNIAISKNGNVVLQVDALCAFIPKQWDLTDSSMNSFCVHGRLENCLFRRLGLTESNVETLRPYYGLFLGKAASPVLRQLGFECAYIGCFSYVPFSGVMEMIGLSQYPGKGYAGVLFEDYRDGYIRVIGTSMDMRLVQIGGYQFGFKMSGMQYTTMTNCTAENCAPMAGETACYAFDFLNPYCIVMNTCATEFVRGGQLRVSVQGNPSFRPSLIVNAFMPIDQQPAVTATPIISIDNAGIIPMSVIINGGDWAIYPSATNVTVPRASGTGLKVRLIGVNGSAKAIWNISGSADVQEF